MRLYLVEILLPLYDNSREPLPRRLFQQVQEELTARFGGLTAHSRVPAEGFWMGSQAQASKDEIVVYEVMTEDLNVAWWHSYRCELESRFRQRAIIVRALETRLL